MSRSSTRKAQGKQQRGPRRSTATQSVALFRKVEESTVDERQARTVGSFYMALVSGLMVQWLVDPARAPSGADVADALRAILDNARPAEQAMPPTA